jgi:protein-S-isoprenylcysteine O-methyltransferase Ste14
MREGIGEEHPFCDSGQNLFILLYLVVWIADSFWLRLSTFLMGSFHWFVRGSLALIFVIVGLYLVQGAHKVVFAEVPSDPKVIDWGVFSYVRHPLYLGVLLIMIGLFFWSLSLLSISIWVGFFFFYERMASYEEEDLIKIFGENYRDYQRRVGKWFPKLLQPNLDNLRNDK